MVYGMVPPYHWKSPETLPQQIIMGLLSILRKVGLLWNKMRCSRVYNESLAFLCVGVCGVAVSTTLTSRRPLICFHFL